mgnify:FL=1
MNNNQNPIILTNKDIYDHKLNGIIQSIEVLDESVLLTRSSPNLYAIFYRVNELQDNVDINIKSNNFTTYDKNLFQWIVALCHLLNKMMYIINPRYYLCYQFKISVNLDLSNCIFL